MKTVTSPLPPGSVIGILGGGQLARMLSLAAGRLGLSCHIYAPEDQACAFAAAAAHTRAAYEDEQALARFAQACAVVTYEFENVPASTAALVEQHSILAPGARALAMTQDRLAEKRFLTDLGLSTAPFRAVDSQADLEAALAALGRPAILKTRHFGYDGKGQIMLRDNSPAEACKALNGVPAILEGFVAFEREISVIAARGWRGELACYDVPDNRHENHILRSSTVPARISAEAAAEARRLAETVLTALDYVGVMGLELFQVGKQLIVNEMAPRVHNSGHWTMDACTVSQFEQHIRAICGWPLGATERHSDAVMHNLLGAEIEAWKVLAARPSSALHIYDKGQARLGRKMGHITFLTPRQKI